MSGKKSKSKGKTIALEPGFLKPPLNSIVKIEAVDWGYVTEEVSGLSEFTIVRGTIYGKVVTCNDEWISLACQVFESGNLRWVLSIPFVTVTKVTVLEKSDE